VLNEEDGLWWLDGKPAGQTIEPLKAAIDQLGDDEDDDYWAATEGNVKRALRYLLAFATFAPNSTWSIR
jgi:hypothetical protein